MDFQELTCKEIGEFCIAREKSRREEMKYLATIGFRTAEKLILAFNMKKPTNISFDKLYPEFGANKPNYEGLTEEQKEEVIQLKWKEFLGK